jgi:glycosyltransferase involved in cell wall biosynthesis
MRRHTGGSAIKAALFLSPETPFPLEGGGALRSASLLTYLAQRYAVDVLVFREPGAQDPRSSFPAGLARQIHVLDLPRNGRYLAARILRNAARLARAAPPLVDRFAGFADQIAELLRGRHYHLAVVEHFWCAPYLEQLAAVSDQTVLDLHNVESLLHARCARVESRAVAVAHRRFQKACLALERHWLPRYSWLLAPSEEDARVIRGIAPDCRIQVFPNAMPLVPASPRVEEHAIVFSGNLEYHPNISAVRFFSREVWPGLRSQWPELIWRVVGKNPHAVWRFTKGDPRVEFSGRVRDAVTEIARAKVAVAPILAGSGTRYKIMEAWAAGLPVVSTRLGAEGLPASDGDNILLADDPRHFQDAVSALLASPDLRRRLGAAGRLLYEENFTWEAAWIKLRL